MIKGKRILLGVCGSIAAYKTAMVIRLLVKEGAEVKVVMTEAATSFITPLTLATLSRNPVVSTFGSKETGEWNNHVELGLWADVMLVAPASANTIAKMAHGMCDNMLLATYLSARCPVMVAPAMDLDMYSHPSTVANLTTLRSYGNTVIDAAYGELASGLTGNGRMAEPEELVAALTENLKKKSPDQPLKNKQLLITAGPTYEAIDPVRYIGNHSSGKMGYALANAAASAGASVVLVSGPANEFPLHKNVELIRVTSAEEMYQACIKHFNDSAIAILAAAVADYKPANVASEKIKKKGDAMTLSLVKTPDIASSLGKIKKDGQLLVGFALETQNEVANAIKKISSKNLDLIVLNSLNDKGAGFGFDTNQVTLIDKNKKETAFPLKSKSEVAADIIRVITSLTV